MSSWVGFEFELPTESYWLSKTLLVTGRQTLTSAVPSAARPGSLREQGLGQSKVRWLPGIPCGPSVPRHAGTSWHVHLKVMCWGSPSSIEAKGKLESLGLDYEVVEDLFDVLDVDGSEDVSEAGTCRFAPKPFTVQARCPVFVCRRRC